MTQQPKRVPGITHLRLEPDGIHLVWEDGQGNHFPYPRQRKKSQSGQLWRWSYGIREAGEGFLSFASSIGRSRSYSRESLDVIRKYDLLAKHLMVASPDA